VSISSRNVEDSVCYATGHRVPGGRVECGRIVLGSIEWGDQLIGGKIRTVREHSTLTIRSFLKSLWWGQGE